LPTQVTRTLLNMEKEPRERRVQITPQPNR
jgi:hypothetical protein